MLNIDLLPRPFSYDRHRVPGYRPQISATIERVGRGKNGWRCTVKVDECAMTISHHARKCDAEPHAERGIAAYAKVHYTQT